MNFKNTRVLDRICKNEPNNTKSIKTRMDTKLNRSTRAVKTNTQAHHLGKCYDDGTVTEERNM